ncbi:MAG: PD-(D/E)XK nuclease family protein [Muribaculaceae bacterium]|nr:PD-(D/E)XK nuclease family protein [Muribaculaceae bacterium]
MTTNTPAGSASITPFLRQVAQYYISKDDPELYRYCFVFPNRRSGTFFLKELSDSILSDKPVITPQVTNITDFMCDITGQTPASQVEALFILYRCYLQLSGQSDKDYPFDRFIFWGNVVLSDFNETDKYLIDPAQLFSNAASLREIGTDYIPDDVKEILVRYLNININSSSDEESFWKHISGTGEEGDSSVTDKYNSLWNSMLSLYNAFRDSLAAENLSYEGKTYRDAVNAIKDIEPHDLRFKRYVFVGFNIISKCEEQLFKHLRQKNVADFFWDNASPALKNQGNCGSRHITANSVAFSMPHDFVPQEISSYPAIRSVAVPSNIGQAQYVARILSGENKEIPYSDDEPDTAVVLPDENLLLPLINALPADIRKINVTMGYPLRNSDIMSLFRSVARMHVAARRRGESWAFFRDFVKDVLSHPVIRANYNSDVTPILHKIDDEFILDVPAQMFAGSPVECLFTIIDENASDRETLRFITSLSDLASDIRQSIITGFTPQGSPDDDAPRGTLPLQCAFIDQFVAILAQLHSVVLRFGIKMSELSVLNIIERLSAVMSIPFEGEPLQGLQIMGTLETRSLDFRNIVILSVNERVFPHKNAFKPSFIPHLLRRAYGLPTVEAQEEASTYYFYRMISRASNVWLIHNNAPQAFGSSEPSRFIRQLRQVYNVDISHREISLHQEPTSEYVVTPHDSDKAAAYFHTDNDIARATQSDDPRLKGVKMLSASSINNFINCPLQFYLQNICGFNNDNPESDFMDAATFGTIVHDSLNDLYFPDGCTSPHNVSLQDINRFISSGKLDKAIKRNINRSFMKRPPERQDEPLTGQAVIIFEALKLYAMNAINQDRQLLRHNGGDSAFFQVLECEQPHYLNLKIGDVCFNFQFRADRIDRLNGTGPVRIIDYKTGSDKTSFADIAELFTTERDKRKKAILQLFLYCNAYLQLHPDVDEVQPIIYSLRNDVFKVAFGKSQSAKQITINRTSELNKDFIDNMIPVLNNLRSGNFTQTADNDDRHCSYCRFADICHK